MLTDRAMHIHIPRTGGTTIRHFMPSLPGITVIASGAHLSYSHMASHCHRRGMAVPPAFVFIRNPWSWYVSQWVWLSRLGQKGQAGRSFRQFMYAVMEHRRKGNDFLNLTTLTQAWAYLEAEKAQYVGRFEGFRTETIRILRAIMPEMSEEQLGLFVAGAGTQRQTKQHYGDWREHYTFDLQRWVWEEDAALIERYGYSFG
jgi:hypothetical protein